MTFSPEDNKAISDQHEQAKQKEAGPKRYIYDRDLIGYKSYLKGYEGFLQYVLSRIDEKSILLDIGCGTGKAMKELEGLLKTQGKDIEIRGTNLQLIPGLEYHLEPGRIYQTSAERMEGIENESITAMLAVHSVAYSDRPEIAVATLASKLVPGGIFKGVFANPDAHYGDIDPKVGTPFAKAFKELGFDVWFGYPVRGEDGIVVAVKPPFKDNTAFDVVNADFRHYTRTTWGFVDSLS